MDGMHFALLVAGFVLVLAALAAIADDIEARDARRRNGR